MEVADLFEPVISARKSITDVPGHIWRPNWCVGGMLLCRNGGHPFDSIQKKQKHHLPQNAGTM